MGVVVSELWRDRAPAERALARQQLVTIVEEQVGWLIAGR